MTEDRPSHGARDLTRAPCLSFIPRVGLDGSDDVAGSITVVERSRGKVV